MSRGKYSEYSHTKGPSDSFKRAVEILNILLTEDPTDLCVQEEYGGRVIHFGVRFTLDEIRRVKERLDRIKENQSLPSHKRRILEELPPVMRISIHHSLTSSHDDVFERLILAVNGKPEIINYSDLKVGEELNLEVKIQGVMKEVLSLIENSQTQKKLNMLLDGDDLLKEILNIKE